MDLRSIINTDETAPADLSPSLKRKHSLDGLPNAQPPAPPPPLETNLSRHHAHSLSISPATHTPLSQFPPAPTPQSQLPNRHPSYPHPNHSLSPESRKLSIPPPPPQALPPAPAPVKKKKKPRWDPNNLPPWARRTLPRVTAESGPMPMGPPSRPRSAAPAQAAPPPVSPEIKTWEPSIDNVLPYDEITRKLCDFLFEHVVMASPEVSRHLEIEAKIGTLIDRGAGQRVYLPVQTEAVLVGARDVQFESTMNEQQHQMLNKYLNNSVMASRAAKTGPRVPIQHRHTKERDSFYDLIPAALATLPDYARALMKQRHTPKVRVSVDEKTGQELARIVKVRVADFDLHSPNTKYDVRVSVNLELNYAGSVEDLPTKDTGRRKDRMTYCHQVYQIDLTQVTDAQNPIKRHELEVEIDAGVLQEQGSRAQTGASNNYVEVVQGFLNNVRILTRTDPVEA